MSRVRCRWVSLGPRDDGHGLSRYSRRLGESLEEAGCDVDAVSVDVQRICDVVSGTLRVRGAEVVHLQLTRDYWGAGRRQLLNLVLVRVLLTGRTVVITAHDFHTAHRPWPRSPLKALSRLRSKHGWYDVAVRWALGTADLVLTCSDAEADRVSWARPRRLRVVPHYIEERSGVRRDRDEPSEAPVLVVLGFIHRRKGQHWAVRALPHLPGGTQLVLAGSVTDRNTGYRDEVIEEARSLGVAARTRLTGYLSETQLDDELSGADVALAPYERIAASGSIATLVAAGVPLVARRHPYLQELARECPTAVTLYEEDSAPVIADAVRRSVALPRRAQRDELARWAEINSPRRTAERHLEAFLTLRGDSQRPIRAKGER